MFTAVRKKSFAVCEEMGWLFELAHPYASFPFMSVGLGLVAWLVT
jgi:hypothetical protein